jgi:hypothetical protein
MFFTALIDSIITFFQEHLLFTLAFAIVLLFLLFRKPKVFLTISAIVLLLLGILYLISDVSSTGVTYKEKLISKSVDVP